MKRFFIYLGAVAFAGLLALSCNKNGGEQGGDEPGPGPEPEVKKEYYVSSAGAGLRDGSNTENAFSLEDVKDLLILAQTVREAEPQEPDADPVAPVYENLDLVDGYTFIFVDATYETPDNAEDTEGLSIAFPGCEKVVELTFMGSANAVLTGGEHGRVLTIGSQVNLTIDGMTIRDGKLEEANGGGISISSEDDGEASLTLDGTVFINNKVGSSSSGGAIHCGKAVVSAQECVFEASNYGRNGGSIYTNNTAAVVNCTDCTFKSHSYNTGGAANNSKGVQHYVNCTFDGCYTEGGNGGAIHANAADAVVTVDGCQFKSCKARINDSMETSTSKGAGIISVQQADFTVNDCVFEGCEAVTGALIYLQAGNGSTAATGGWFKCNNTQFINNRAADRGLVQTNGSKSNKQGSIGFFNNCVFYGNTMRTNQWGFILHGGNPGVACFNNCTIYGNERQQAGGNGVMLNTDGFIIFTNSTLIGAADLVSIRANDVSNNTRVLLANSVVINTSETTENVFTSGTMKAPLYMYNNILGPAMELPTANVTDEGNVKNATFSSLTDGTYDETSNVYAWNGPDASFTKMTPTAFETAVKNSLDVKLNDFNAYIGDKSLGEFYYGWLTEIGAVGKDALGNDRGASWWPGAYQK